MKNAKVCQSRRTGRLAFMNKTLGLLAAVAIFQLSACTTSQNLAQSGALRTGLSKSQLRDKLIMTSVSEDPFLNDGFSQFFPDLKMEIVGTPARTFFFVFSDVNYPLRQGSFTTSKGDGLLSRWFSTYAQALAYVDSHRAPQPISAPPPGSQAPSTTVPARRTSLQEIASGTGFAVSASGYFVTNHHVIEGCIKTNILFEGNAIAAAIITVDMVNDLALLKASLTPNSVFKISNDNPHLLGDIYVAGYPYGNSLSSSIKVTKGIVSSLVGIGNNSSVFQIDAAIQPGNSGGPIVDPNGNVVGVAVASLDQKAIFERFGALPQNTNFGIKSTVLTNLLKSNSINFRPPSSSPIDSAGLGKLMTDATFYVSCLGYK